VQKIYYCETDRTSSNSAMNGLKNNAQKPKIPELYHRVRYQKIHKYITDKTSSSSAVNGLKNNAHQPKIPELYSLLPMLTPF
jgi:hypothetical protein